MFLLLFPLVSSCCLAFGFPGHRLVAALAFDQLPDSLCHECLGFPSRQRRLNKLAFIRLACRPDRIKHRPGMEWAQPLHFLNVLDDPPTCCHAADDIAFVSDDGQPNLLMAVANYTLRMTAAPKPLSKDDQSQILSFMVHFVTDLHQPLHVSSKAKGGNRVKVLFDGKRRSLHSLWDTTIIDKFMEEHSPREANRILRRRVAKFMHYSDDQLLEWAAQTNAVNCQCVWNLTNGDDYADSYYQRALPRLLDLIALAALRTRKLLSLACQ